MSERCGVLVYLKRTRSALSSRAEKAPALGGTEGVSPLPVKLAILIARTTRRLSLDVLRRRFRGGGVRLWRRG